MCAAHVNNFSSNLVERVDFNDVRVALLRAGLYVFLNCPRRDFAQKAKSRGGSLVTCAYILRKVLAVEIYSDTVNIEKISNCLNRGREESVGNDDVSIVFARKYEMVRMT